MAKIYYSQVDSRWRNHPYPASGGYENKTIGTSGCGPTCSAMVISSCKETITPAQMGDIFRENGFRVPGGTQWDAFTYIGQRWGIETKILHSSFEAHQACKEGWFVIINCASGLWTTGGHYILAVGATDTDIEIYDPYLYANKFNMYGRNGKVNLQGTSAWVNINTFKASSNAQRFIAFKVGGTEPAPQPATKIMYINTKGSNLNVRNAPGGGVTGSLKNGTQVTVYNEQNGWSQIGSTSWVASQYLAAEPSVVASPAQSNKYSTGKYKVTASLLKVRKGAGRNETAKTWNQLSANAQAQNKKLGNSKANGYLKGVTCTVTQVQGNWGLTASGWICLDYCSKI